MLEITETLLMGDDEQIWADLAVLQELGVRIAIDDFGTGYSSLGYLRRWPVDTLKIDRSFLNAFEEDPESRLLVGAMVNLAHALTMDVTAEGIETADQLACVRHMGVARGQGYFFAPPLPAEEFACLLAQGDRYDVGRRRTASAGRKRSRTTEPQVTTTKGQPGQILPG
jgi:EAL domain-containing protein (putative c-di-GMP-specific phosphodiesterase class I)